MKVVRRIDYGLHLIVHLLALLFAALLVTGCGRFETTDLGVLSPSDALKSCDRLTNQAVSAQSAFAKRSATTSQLWDIALIDWACAEGLGMPSAGLTASWKRRDQFSPVTWRALASADCILGTSNDVHLRKRPISQAQSLGIAPSATSEARLTDWWSDINPAGASSLRAVWQALNPRANITRPVLVAVLDTGVDLNHPGLVDSIARRADGTTLGFNVVDNGQSPPQDQEGHGTAVSGFIAGKSRDGSDLGVAVGLAQIIPVKVLGDDGGGRLSDVANGIRWAADNGADIINLSLGAAIPGGLSSPDARVMRDAMLYAVEKGALVVAAAGNGDANGRGYDITRPGSYDSPGTEGSNSGVLAVAAIDLATGHLASFSNFGVKSVEIAAPGASRSGLWTTLKGGAWGSQFDDGRGSGPPVNGTSFAAPIVAGTAAAVQAIAIQLREVNHGISRDKPVIGRLTPSSLEDLTKRLSLRDSSLYDLVGDARKLSLGAILSVVDQLKQSFQSNGDGALELCHD